MIHYYNYPVKAVISVVLLFLIRGLCTSYIRVHFIDIRIKTGFSIQLTFQQT